jgi:glycosyltransferase involved in cell wall biosynthesis
MKSSNSIVLLVPGFPENEEDSTCIPALQLFAKNFDRVNSSLDLIIIAFQYPFKKGEYSWNGITVYSAGGKGKGKFFRLFTWITVIKYFFKIKSQRKISGIHSFWLSECALVGQFLSKLFSLPHVASLMGQDARSSNKYLKYLNLSQMIITSGSDFASDILKNNTGFNSSIIIPFGIENKNGSLNNLNRDFDIIGVGSLILLKNYFLFIDIIEELVNEFPLLKSVLIGEGELKEEISRSIINKNLSGNIFLTGKLQRNEVLDYMKKSRIFLHTSEYESQGLVFLEALYCGLSVVAFDTGFLPESKKVYKCTNRIDLADNLRKLLRCKKEYNPEIHITAEDTAKRFNEIYSRIGMI